MASVSPGELEELRRQLDRASQTSADLSLLAEVARELAQSLEVTDVGEVVTRTAVIFTGAALCSLWIFDQGQKPQVISQTEGIAVANLPPLPARLSLLEEVFSSKQMVISIPRDPGDPVCAALPLLFGDTLLAVLELVGCPLPERMDEQVQTIQNALPIAALSLKNALATARLREALEEIRQKNLLLEAQNEELQAQNEEIQAQAHEIQAQNEELAEYQRELEGKNAEIERANRELAHLVETGLQQEARLRAIIDAVADGLMVVDGQQKVTAINPALEVLIGYKREELIDRSCKYLLGARNSDGVFICDFTCPFLHPEGRCPQNVDATVTTRDGQRIWVNVAYGPIYDKEGRPTAVVHAIRDISAKKEIEQLKDEFLSMTAHDLKTPLAAIKGYAQMLRLRALRDQARVDELKSLEAIDAQAGRMLDMINRLLDFTRVQMGRLELSPEPIDLVRLAARVVEQAQVTTDLHQLLLSAEDGDITGTWDRSYIEQVLGNLVDNAIKYSPQGGRVEIVLRRSGGEVLISVQDQGIGISKADQSRLFERYFRAAQARRGAKGLGLGLYICRGLVEAHGGRIWMESQEGQGSTFQIALPLQPGATETKTTTTEA